MSSSAIHPSNDRTGTAARRAAVLLCAAIGVALAGCSVEPLPALKPPLPDAWRHAPQGVAPPAADLRRWWQALGDPALDGLIDRALRGNLDVAQAAERLKAARLIGGHAKDAYLPNVHGRTNDVVNPDTSASYFMVGFDASWEFPLFGAWQSTRRIADGQVGAAQAALRGAQVSLVAEVTRRWVELRSAQRQEGLLTAIRDAQQEKLRLLRTRVDLKLAPPAEAARAEADLARAEAALAEPRQAINANAQQLAVLLGQNEPDPAWLEPGAQPRLGDWQLTAAPADLLRTRPEIAGAEAEVIRAAGELGMSRADIYPHIGFGSSMQWSINIATNHRARNHEGIFSAGPVIDIPLFDWGQRVATAHAKDHDLNAALFAYRQAVLQGVAEAEVAMGDLEQLRGREQALAQAAQASGGGVAATRKRAELGLGSGLDLQDSLIDSHRAELELAAAIAQRDLAYVSLYKALGGAPMPEPPPSRSTD
ncbi:TolC family protein [Dyella sp. BiH032]|uniref:TolC family protein n=1 Tax=Dyella sp. BiH032 TaxID=3075430 RepID=UPI002892D738|nr:TolC family protein [Dyella sp. BiH032]WNL45188.1 TolC family protein [Dyella sp. BiH032]